MVLTPVVQTQGSKYLKVIAVVATFRYTKQDRHERLDQQDHGLAWILQNRTLRQWWHAGYVAATVAVLPSKNQPWWALLNIWIPGSYYRAHDPGQF